MATLPIDKKIKLLKLKQDELSISLIVKLFGRTSTKDPETGKMIIKEPEFDTKDIVKLAAGEYINKEAITTTVGSILFNKLLVEGRFEDIIENGFYDGEVTNKRLDEFHRIIIRAARDGKIKVYPTLIDYVTAYENYSLKLVAVFSPSYNMEILKPDKAIIKERDRLIKEEKPKTPQEMAKIEDRLVKQAQSDLKDNPAYSLYESGARGSFSNNYKNISIMVGPVENPGTGEYDLARSNFIEGISKEDWVAAGNIAVNAEYPKAVGTQVGGYQTKYFYAGLQSIVLDKKGTDCGSKKYLELVLTPELAKGLELQYMVINGKLVLLTQENAKKYIGKKIKFRSPLYCLTDKICNICAGERAYISEIENIGLTAARIPNTLLNMSMKKRHDPTVKISKVNLETLII